MGRTSMNRLFYSPLTHHGLWQGRENFGKAASVFFPDQREQCTEQVRRGDPTLREDEDASEALSPD